MSQRGQKAMLQPLNVLFDFLKKKTRIQIWLYEQTDTRIEGVIIGMDEYMNLVIDDADECSIKKETRKQIGRILLKGDNVTLIAEAPQK